MRRRIGWLALAVTIGAGGCTVAAGDSVAPDGTLTTLAPVATTVSPSSTTSAPPVVSTTVPIAPTTTAAPGLVADDSVGAPWGSVDGITMFRGNPTRTFYGSGPVPEDPALLWRFPDSAMCGNSPLSGQDVIWCGTGWTGQPAVWERPDGITEVIFGAYDKAVHFLDAATGRRTRPDFPMGDIIKGSVVLDPDGFPLLYVGSRDPDYRVIALDGDTPREVWALSALSVNGIWNNDWDSNAVIVDDLLLIGGENSYWFAVKLNRSYDEAGRVTVDPDVVTAIPAFTPELRAAVGNQQSIESSTAVYGDVAFFGNGAGRVVGIDLAQLPDGEADIVFDFWVGDDVDATIVIDGDGMLYVSAEEDLRTARAAEIGQLIKLDPSRPNDPLVWGIEIPGTGSVDGGIWATPALHRGYLYVATNPGELLVVDTATGEVVWSDDVGTHAWSSPAIVDDTLVVAVNCEVSAALRAYDLADPAAPRERWEVAVTGGCIESTPAIWKDRIYVGSRDGFFYAIGDP